MQIDTHIADIIDNIIIDNDIIDMVIIAIPSLSTLLSSTVVHQKQSFIALYVRLPSHSHRYYVCLLFFGRLHEFLRVTEFPTSQVMSGSRF